MLGFIFPIGSTFIVLVLFVTMTYKLKGWFKIIPIFGVILSLVLGTMLVIMM